MQRFFCLSLTLCALVPSLTVIAAEKSPANPDFYPVSVWYSGGKARAPMLSEITPESEKEWRADLEQIKRLGFNTVRTWVEWAHCEPRKGEYHFENLQLLCKLAQEAGLRVIVQIYGDSAPDWVGQVHPDAQYEAQSGAKVPSQAAPGYCSDKREVGELVARFYSEAAKSATKFSNLYAWDLWSEPHIINWAIINYVPDAQFCFCPHTRARFREWLMKKYGSLDGLNKAWYRNFAKLNEVDPPRFGTILSYTDFIDWKSFIYEKLAADMRLRYDAVRRVDQEHAITSHAAVPSIFGSPFNGDGASDDFLMADEVTYYGTSIYPKHSFPRTHWPHWQINLAIDFSRSANLKRGGFYIGELQAGFGVRGVVVGDPVTPEDHRVWMWSLLAKGAKALNLYAYYPMSSSYESGGYGLIELDGKITPRAEAAGRTAKIIHRNRKMILESKPEAAQIALVYNPLAQMVGGEQNSGPAGGMRDSLIGYYRGFSEQGIPVDFVHRRDLEAGLAPQYKLLILPYPIMLTTQAADGIRRFVEQGGYVVSEARLAWNDARGQATPVVPGMGLSPVFGVREAKVKMGESVPIKISGESHPAVAGLANETIKGSYFAESFETLPGAEAKVLATLEDDSPAIVASRHGQGETLMIGSFLGLGSHPNWTENNRKFIRNLAEWARVTPRLTRTLTTKADPPLEVTFRSLPDGGLLFVVNPAMQPQKAAIRIRMDADGAYTLRDLLGTAEASQAKTDQQQLSLDLEIPARDAKVLQVTTGK